MTEVNNVFKLEQKEWEGYVRAKLEIIAEDLAGIKKNLELLDKCVNGVKIKVAAIGATVSLLVTVMTLLIRDLLSK